MALTFSVAVEDLLKAQPVEPASLATIRAILVASQSGDVPALCTALLRVDAHCSKDLDLVAASIGATGEDSAALAATAAVLDTAFLLTLGAGMRHFLHACAVLGDQREFLHTYLLEKVAFGLERGGVTTHPLLRQCHYAAVPWGALQPATALPPETHHVPFRTKTVRRTTAYLDKATVAAAFRGLAVGLLTRIVGRMGIVAAGGCVLQALTGAPAADVDLFLVGHASAKEAAEAVSWALEQLREGAAEQRDDEGEPIPFESALLLSGQALTVHLSFGGSRTDVRVQFVLRAYRTLGQVLSSFDLPPTRVAYDGNNFFCTATALHAIRMGVTVPDPLLVTHPVRALKYHLKGFLYSVPCLMPGYAETLGAIHMMSGSAVRDVLLRRQDVQGVLALARCGAGRYDRVSVIYGLTPVFDVWSLINENNYYSSEREDAVRRGLRWCPGLVPSRTMMVKLLENVEVADPCRRLLATQMFFGAPPPRISWVRRRIGGHAAATALAGLQRAASGSGSVLQAFEGSGSGGGGGGGDSASRVRRAREEAGPWRQPGMGLAMACGALLVGTAWLSREIMRR